MLDYLSSQALNLAHDAYDSVYKAMLSRRDSLRLVCQAAFAAPALAKPSPERISVTSFVEDGAKKPGRRELQLAIDASSRWGVPAYIPPNCTVLLDNDGSVILRDGVALEGSGPSSVITADFSSRQSNCLLRNDWEKGSSDIRLSNFTLDRSGPGIEHGILLNGVSSLLVDGIFVSGVTRKIAGVLAISSILNSSGPARRISRNVIVRNCQIDDCGNFGIQVGHIDGLEVRNCIFRRAFREAIGVEPEMCDTAQNIIVADNKIYADPNLDQGTQTGLIILTMTSGGLRISGVLVRDNYIEFSKYRQDRRSPGIGIYGKIDASVIKNTIIGSPGAGIHLGSKFETIGKCENGPHRISGRTTGVKVSDNVVIYNKSGDAARQIMAPVYDRSVGTNELTDNKLK